MSRVDGGGIVMDCVRGCIRRWSCVSRRLSVTIMVHIGLKTTAKQRFRLRVGWCGHREKEFSKEALTCGGFEETWNNPMLTIEDGGQALTLRVVVYCPISHI